MSAEPIRIDIPDDEPRLFADDPFVQGIRAGRVEQGFEPTIPADDVKVLAAIAAKQLSVDDFCICDVPSPILTDGVDGPECATCRRALAS
jgi:hypothetical protein